MIKVSAAAKILKAGGVVSFPTETVYGLGARADCDSGIREIYRLKGRPSFNPLILHGDSFEMLEEVVDIPPHYRQVLYAFWPGPLTAVFAKKNKSSVSKLATAGLSTVAVRIPQHPLALELLKAVGSPLVAPSANISGSMSPTQAVHVQSCFPDVPVLDGGACTVGLESTIIDLTGEVPQLLRPGGVSLEDLETAFKTSFQVRDPGTELPVTAPGQLKRHYAPDQPVRLNAGAKHAGEIWIGFGDVSGADLNLSPQGDLSEAAQNLFQTLRQAESFGVSIAVSSVPNHGIGAAINDRLQRASVPKGEGCE